MPACQSNLVLLLRLVSHHAQPMFLSMVVAAACCMLPTRFVCRVSSLQVDLVDVMHLFVGKIAADVEQPFDYLPDQLPTNQRHYRDS